LPRRCLATLLRSLVGPRMRPAAAPPVLPPVRSPEPGSPPLDRRAPPVGPRSRGLTGCRPPEHLSAPLASPTPGVVGGGGRPGAGRRSWGLPAALKRTWRERCPTGTLTGTHAHQQASRQFQGIPEANFSGESKNSAGGLGHLRHLKKGPITKFFLLLTTCTGTDRCPPPPSP
jgi:hypothetical protein